MFKSLLFVATFALAALAQNCPYNSVYFPTTNKCYQSNGTLLYWDDAMMACFRQGGSLVSIHSSAENAFIADLMSKIAPIYWIGLNTELEYTKNYMWTDNSPVNYTNWSPDVPDACMYGAQPCVFTETYSRLWLNCWQCYKQMAYVCELPLLSSVEAVAENDIAAQSNLKAARVMDQRRKLLNLRN